jgi:hypothetical protein
VPDVRGLRRREAGATAESYSASVFSPAAER